MITNQIMIRPLADFKVEQRTKDGYFNSTELLKAWNVANSSNKELKDYLSNKATQEFIKALCEEENLNGDKSPYLATRAKTVVLGCTLFSLLISLCGSIRHSK